ncbi:MAG: hypothetical protein FWF59_00570 [Turicibacter sp.]|nr:hypothetical protein [Turicibacter sp.]
MLFNQQNPTQALMTINKINSTKRNEQLLPHILTHSLILTLPYGRGDAVKRQAVNLPPCHAGLI